MPVNIPTVRRPDVPSRRGDGRGVVAARIAVASTGTLRDRPWRVRAVPRVIRYDAPVSRQAWVGVDQAGWKP
jgi:hypothetical protein